jgi:uroporphyrinogen-III synthase
MGPSAGEDLDIGVLHEVGSLMAEADALHEVLERVVDFALALVNCDSCFIYVLDNDELVLRASRNPHGEIVDRLRVSVGQGITGWVAEHGSVVALPQKAFEDPRFQFFNEVPEDCFEAFLSVPLLSRGRTVGVMNLQHRLPHSYSRRQVQLISAIGFLVGAEIELARLEGENSDLSEQLKTRKLVERAKGILQRELGVNEEQAYLALQRQSRQKRRSMKEIAEAIVLSDEVKRHSLIDP